MLLSRVTAHKITNFRCKYLATMATGDDDDDNEGGTTTTTTTTIVMTRRARDTTTMAADDDDNEVNGNGVTGDDDGYVR